MDVKIIAVIVGALLGGTISTASFYFKNRKEVKEKVNESLFQLLEVWTIIAIIRVSSSEKFHEILVSRMRERFPHEKIGEKEEAQLKEGMIQALPLLTGMKTNNIDRGFLEKYKTSVSDLAKIYPLLAFGLSRNQMLIEFLGSLDKLASESPVSETDVAILNNVRELMLGESFKDLEVDLIKLASASGFRNKRETKSHIARLKGRLSSMPSDTFDEYIDNVIAPVIQAHYDKAGVVNPNVVGQKEPNKAMHVTSA